MQAGTHDQSLRRVADRLLAEFSDEEALGLPGLGSSIGAAHDVSEVLDAEQEATVARLRDALTAIASTLRTEVDDLTVQMIQITLDGAEFVIRGELVRDNAERVLDLLPSFVFLVALTVAERDRALELSRRTEELIAWS